MSRKKFRFTIWDFIVIILIIMTGIGLFITTSIRSTRGIETFFSNPRIIVLDYIFYIILFGLIIGYVISFFLRKANG